MKKGLSIILILLTVFFISGCITGNVVQDSCNAPYTYMGGDCCLDKNQDKICDKDTAEVRSFTGAEDCKFDREFTCLGKKITSNAIELKIRHDRSGIASITKIELPNVGDNGCKQVTNGLIEDGIDFDQEKIIVVSCPDIGDFVDTPILLEAKVYEKSRMRGNVLTPYTTYDVSTEGYLAGIVQE